MTATETWTWTELRAQTVARLQAAGVCGGRIDKSRFTPIEADGVSRVRVYLRSGSYASEGKASEPHFVRTRSLVVSVTRAAGIDEDLDDDLDGDVDAVLAALLTAPAWLAGMEEVQSVQVDYDSQTGSSDNIGEWRSIEAIIRIDVADRERFAPVIPDALEEVQITAPAYPGKDAGMPLGATLPIESGE